MRDGAKATPDELQHGDVILHPVNGDKLVFQYATLEHDGRVKVNCTTYAFNRRRWFTVSRTKALRFAIDSRCIDSRCPDCESDNWHNGWLCKECGYPHRPTWLEHYQNGFIKPRTKRGRERMAAAIAGAKR